MHGKKYKYESKERKGAQLGCIETENVALVWVNWKSG